MSNVKNRTAVLTMAQYEEMRRTGRLPDGVKTFGEGEAGQPLIGQALTDILDSLRKPVAPPPPVPAKRVSPFIPDGEVKLLDAQALSEITERAVALATDREVVTQLDRLYFETATMSLIRRTAECQENPMSVLGLFNNALEAVFRAGYSSAAADVMTGKLKLT